MKAFSWTSSWAASSSAPVAKVRGHIKDNPVVKILEELNATEEDKANILGDNAARLFKL